MQKKVFLNKNTKPRKHPYLKLFFWAGIFLIVLAAVAPLLIHRMSRKELASQRPAPERGVIVREIPRALAPPSENVLSLPAESESPAARTSAAGMAAVPGSRGAPDAQGKDSAASPATDELPGGQGGSGVTPAGQAPSKELATTTAPSAGAPAVTGKSDAGRAGSPAPAAAARAKKPAAPEAKTARAAAPSAQAAAKKRAPGECKPLYVVQVGSFKEKQNAEEVERSLRKRGYDAVIIPQSHPKLGQIYVVQLKPVPDEGKASTLVSQVGHEAKVKPVIIKVSE